MKERNQNFQSAAGFVDAIFEVFAKHGNEHYGEGVTQIEHALQCAQLATMEKAGDALIAAALLHDLGHFVDGRGNDAELKGIDAHHERRGAAMLRSWFGPEVTTPIALHVAAKRYLCAVEKGYAEGLSPASKVSFKLQGGAFSAKQIKAFESRPFAADAVRLRRWDDAGKIDGTMIAPLSAYAPVLKRLVPG